MSHVSVRATFPYLTSALILRILASWLQQYATDRVLVRFKPDTARSTSTVTVSGVSQTAASAAHVGRAATSDVTHVFEITDGMSVADKVKQLSALPEVAIVEPDYIVNVYDTPSDPKFSDQWHHPKISTPIAWDTTTGSPTLKVCVIDSGLRIDHPDLAANVIKGWSVISPTPGGPNPAPTDPAFLNYNDTLGHGTHVSGIIGAVGNNDRGVSGVAWTIGLMPCRFISDSGAGYVSDAITCMQLCQAEGALVYSNSWGGVGFSQTLLAEIQALQTTNGVFVVAAGNNDGLDLDNSPLYPASYTEDNVITVAASTQTDTLAGFSNIGPHSVHLAAPGNSIYSTTYDGLYGTMSGTSMATPMVAGAAALLQGMAVAANAPLAPAQIRQLIMGSVDPIPGGAAAVMSGGRLNVANAVTALKAQFPTQKWPNTPPTGIQVPVAPISSPLPQSPLPQVPQTPRDTGLSVGSMPQCGASPLRGQPATQSSDYNGRSAQNAVNGDCRTDPKKYPSACSSTGEQTHTRAHTRQTCENIFHFAS